MHLSRRDISEWYLYAVHIVVLKLKSSISFCTHHFTNAPLYSTLACDMANIQDDFYFLSYTTKDTQFLSQYFFIFFSYIWYNYQNNIFFFFFQKHSNRLWNWVGLSIKKITLYVYTYNYILLKFKFRFRSYHRYLTFFLNNLYLFTLTVKHKFFCISFVHTTLFFVIC